MIIAFLHLEEGFVKNGPLKKFNWTPADKFYTEISIQYFLVHTI